MLCIVVLRAVSDDVYWKAVSTGLGNLLGNKVFAMQCIVHRLVAGGWFTSDGSRNDTLNHTAALSHPDTSWVNVVSGLSWRGYSLQAIGGHSGPSGNELVVGGEFDVAGTTPTKSIARWTKWSGGPSCPIDQTGDVDVNCRVDAADIIYLVNYGFTSEPNPRPCEAAGDVNCANVVTSADIIYLISYVFKSGPHRVMRASAAPWHVHEQSQL